MPSRMSPGRSGRQIRRAAGLDFKNYKPEGFACTCRSRNESRMKCDAEPGIGRARGKKIAHGVTRNGQRQAARDHRVNAHDAPVRVGQRSAGVSRREAHVGLHPGLWAEPAQSAHCVDHSRSQRADETQWIADRDGNFAGAQFGRNRRRTRRASWPHQCAVAQDRGARRANRRSRRIRGHPKAERLRARRERRARWSPPVLRWTR